MRAKNFIISVIVIGLSMITINLWAEDYRDYSTEKMMEMRESINTMHQDDRESFQAEMQIRIKAMSPEERLYNGVEMMHDYNDMGSGSGYHNDMGSGYMHDNSGNNRDHRGYSHRRGGGC